jgi:hypothetical protein
MKKVVWRSVLFLDIVEGTFGENVALPINKAVSKGNFFLDLAEINTPAEAQARGVGWYTDTSSNLDTLC